MKSLAIHRKLAEKLESGRSLTQDEIRDLHRGYEWWAPGVHRGGLALAFLDDPRGHLISHMIRMWSMAQTVVYYLGLEEYPYRKPATLVDVGCGDGDLARLLKSWRFAAGNRLYYLGLELDLAKIQSARAWYENKNYRFEICDFREHLSLEDSFADMWVLTEALEHVSKIDGIRLLDELNRITKRSGYGVLTTPVRKPGRRYRTPCHLHEWGLEELRTELTQRFKIVDSFFFGVPSRLLKPLMPSAGPARVGLPWLRNVLGPASGLPGDVQAYVVKKELRS